MSKQEIILQSNKQYQLIGHYYASNGQSKGAILIANAMGVTQKYYNHLASFLAENNYDCLSFDYRGTGKSAPKKLKNFQANLFDWVEDLSIALAYLKEKFPDQKLYYISHSVGSQLMGFIPNNHLIDKSIFLASSVGYWKEHGKEKWKNLFILSTLLPFINFLWGYTNAKALGLGDNYPKGVAMHWRSWCLHPKYLGVELDKKDQANYFEQYQNKISAFWFSDDAVASLSAVNKLLDFYKNAIIERTEISPESIAAKKIGHIGFLSRKFKDSIWTKILSQLDEH